MSSFEDWLNQEFKERGFRIEEATLLPEIGLDYWHSTILDKSTYPISGGFASSRMQARKIAMS